MSEKQRDVVLRNLVAMDADLYLRLPVYKYKLLEFEAIDDLIEVRSHYTKERLKDWLQG